MSKITRRVATVTATVAVTGGVTLGASGAASAATYEHRDHSHSVATSYGERPGDRHHDRVFFVNGERFRFDGHHFFVWVDGKWKLVSRAFARHHLFDRDHDWGRFSRDHKKHEDRDRYGHDRHSDYDQY
ncbi:hypothetical protein [Nonomuraea turcica]|uniref:hypothetical protein n=1 Tax=Nonomuraea sp. G32 TaxID=3067274 RepID=UPI00273B05CF|nr:hypothetical protein [Nonomuraea sp. G32]MDP4505915.1 hypothetical protein [Nonomuraea sp. G32]